MSLEARLALLAKVLGEEGVPYMHVAEILAVQGQQLDIIQIERWVEELGVWKQWRRVLELNDLLDESG